MATDEVGARIINRVRAHAIIKISVLAGFFFGANGLLFIMVVWMFYSLWVLEVLENRGLDSFSRDFEALDRVSELYSWIILAPAICYYIITVKDVPKARVQK